MSKAGILFFTGIFTLLFLDVPAQRVMTEMDPTAPVSIFLNSHKGSPWYMQKATEAGAGAVVSSAGYQAKGWLPAIVPGTVLNSLVHNKKYPDPYYGDNNRRSRNLIPDL